jgi:hypothetical protein
MWEIGEKGAGLRQIVGVAEQENLELVRLSYAPFFPQQVFLEFQRVKLAKLS